MIKVHSDNKLETFQVLGDIIRVHWNHEYIEQDQFDDVKTRYWTSYEIVVPVTIPVQELENKLKAHGAPVEQMMLDWNL